MSQKIDNISRIALREAQERSEELDEIKVLKAEFDTLKPRMISIVQESGMQFAEDNIEIMEALCFGRTSPQELSEKFGLKSTSISSRKNRSLGVILEEAEKGNITMSSQLQEWLRGPKKIQIEKDPIETLRERIRQILRLAVKGVRGYRLSLTDSDVDAFVSKMEKAEVESDDLRNFVGFANVSAANWVRSSIRKIDAAPRIAARNKKLAEKRAAIEQEKEASQRKYEERLERTHGEFKELMTALAVHPAYNTGLALNIEILYYTIFRKESDNALAYRFPGTSRAMRDQWRKRGRDFLWELLENKEIKMSPHLQMILLKGTRGKRKIRKK